MPLDTTVVAKQPLDQLSALAFDIGKHDLDIALFEEGRLGKHTIRALTPALTDQYRALRDAGNPEACENHRLASKAFVTQMAETATEAGMNLKQMKGDIEPYLSANRGGLEMKSLFDRAAELQQINDRYDSMLRNTPDTHATPYKKVTFSED